MLYDDAIDTVLTLRDVAPALFFDGSELMSLGAELLAQAEALPGLQEQEVLDEEEEAEARFQEELHMFYDLHPIPEGDEDFDDTVEDNIEVRRESGTPVNFESKRQGRESREFNPDEVGSARGSYDSDECVHRHQLQCTKCISHFIFMFFCAIGLKKYSESAARLRFPPSGLFPWSLLCSKPCRLRRARIKCAWIKIYHFPLPRKRRPMNYSRLHKFL